MRINTQNVTLPQESYPTPIGTPICDTSTLFNTIGIDERLPCQWTNVEALLDLHSPSPWIMESQPALPGTQELPDLPHAQIHMYPEYLVRHFEGSEYDSFTNHPFASPIWSHYESPCTGGFQFQNAGKEVIVRSDGDFPAGLEANTEPPDASRRNGFRCILGCGRTYKRMEHLQRHIKTYHTNHPEYFSCEFCGKSDFTRADNLRIHRRLHARQPRRNARVQFVPEAVLIIEREIQSKKARQQP
ncbi:hypothetical protein FOFC_20506 [Fusarium oxysporum]|nr:hypothetical protein FOFC_20506 [Fusarium oxysporum]